MTVFDTRAGKRMATVSAALALSLSSLPATVAGQRSHLTVERIASAPSFIGTAPSRPTWSPDGRWLAFLWNDRGGPTRDVWLVESTGTSPRRLTHLAGDGGEVATGGVSELIWTPDGAAVLYLQSGDVWRIPAGGGGAERLTDNGGVKSDLAVAPA